MTEAGPQKRHRSIAVDVGGVTVGAGAPIVVQPMTNTDTGDVEATTRQVADPRARAPRSCDRRSRRMAAAGRISRSGC
jgi:hypothetical protein